MVSFGALASAVAVMVRLRVWRRRRNSGLGPQQEDGAPVKSPITLDAPAFQAHAERTAVGPEQCVLMAETPFCIRNLWQGSFTLIAADLEETLGRANAAASLAVLKAHGVPDAFLLRRELVNLKKACLRTFHDVDKVLEALQRQDSYFFRDTSSGHVRGCFALPRREDVPVDLDAHRSEYESVCHAFQRAKGLVLAMNDARECAVPFARGPCATVCCLAPFTCAP